MDRSDEDVTVEMIVVGSILAVLLLAAIVSLAWR